MLRLVNQLLDFRKIQNKKMKVLVEKTELVSQLQKIMESFHLIAKKRELISNFKLIQTKYTHG